jgi:hypothetical protein
MRSPIMLLTIVATCLAACDDSSPGVGTVRVSAATAGADTDLDGYVVAIEGVDPQTIGPNDTVVIPGLPDGARDVRLEGVAVNCSVNGDNPRAIRVVRDDTVSAAFAVGCLATGVHVSSTTTGIDLDADGYALFVDGTPRDSLDAVGSTIVTRMDPGSHIVLLEGLAGNCTVADSNLRTVTVAVGETVPVNFVVTCVSQTGLMQLATATTGSDLDGDGYTVQVNGGSPTPLAANGIVTFSGLSGGDYAVQLNGAATNCAVAGDNPRTVTVKTGGLSRDTARTTFAVSCGAVGAVLLVTTATSGIDTDSGYAVQVDGGPPVSIEANETATFAGLGAGDHSVTLQDVATNCTAAGANPRTISVTTGGPTPDTARTTFSLSCVATTGLIEVSTATSGIDLDPDGFTIQVDAGSAMPVVVNGDIQVPDVPQGDHPVTLGGLNANCTVTGSNPRIVTVATGGSTRDTARVAFDVTCVRLWTLAYSRTAWDEYYGNTLPTIRASTTDGSTQAPLMLGESPAWSPDGASLAFVRTKCDGYDYYYYYYYCYRDGLVRSAADGSEPVRLTTDGADADPAWEPNGARLAFIRNQTLRLVNADGTGNVLLLNIGFAAHPSWSPDGSSLAFTCQLVSGNQDICRVNKDGTGLARLTSDTARDSHPSWSPDGSRIVFSTTRFSGFNELAVMNADGSGVIRLSPGTAAIQPAWSPDGTQIAFSAIACDAYAGCTALGVSVINADGTGLTRISTGQDRAPAWRP